MIEESIPYKWYDYIDRIIEVDGFKGDFSIDSYWTGYKVLIRSDLDTYVSVNDWNQGDGGIISYFHRIQPEYKDIIISGFENTPQEFYHDMLLSLSSRNEYKTIYPSKAYFWLYELVLMSRRKFTEHRIEFEDVDMDKLIESKLDRDSRMAKYYQSLSVLNKSML